MSQPRDPYREQRRPPYQQPRQPYPQQQPQPYGRPDGQREYSRPDYGRPEGGQPEYGQPDYGRPDGGWDYGQRDYGQRDYGQQDYAQPDYGQRAQAARARQPRVAPPVPSGPSGGIRLPGLGLVLTAVGFVVQVLSLTVLPLASAAGGGSVSVPELWRAAHQVGAHGFGGSYMLLFSYPLAALSIVLALATVLDSVVLKVIWGGLTLVGLGVLVLRFGFGPFATLATGKGDLTFTRQEITIAVIAVAALVAVIFVLRTAFSMFRRVGGLILLGLAAVHVAAVVDLVKGSGANLSIGAFGPAIGYVLIAVATFVGPRRLPGV